MKKTLLAFCAIGAMVMMIQGCETYQGPEAVENVMYLNAASTDRPLEEGSIQSSVLLRHQGSYEEGRGTVHGPATHYGR
ncbi:MAG: hypothetical protein WBE18_05145 [Gammaproteobacteria bacterium]